MTKKLMLVLAMLLVAFFAFAQQSPTGQGPTVLNGGLTSVPGGFSGAGPNNTGGPGLGRHDLKDMTTGNPIGCESCHIPHTAPSYGMSFNWAWNKLPTSLSTYYTTLNPSVSLTAPATGAGPATAAPTGNTRSMLCFSCHDGTSASANGVVGGVTYNGLPYQLVMSSVSASLGNQHPVDALVPATSDYVQPTTTGTFMYGATATIGTQALPMWNTGAGNARIECGTCHDVHNDYPAPATSGPGTGGIPFLRQDNTNGTYLCRQCHNAQ